MPTNQEVAQLIVSPELLASEVFNVYCEEHGQISDGPIPLSQALSLKGKHAIKTGCHVTGIHLQDK